MEVLDSTGRDQVIGLCLNFGMIRVFSLSAFLCRDHLPNASHQLRFQVWSHEAALFTSRIISRKVFSDCRTKSFPRDSVTDLRALSSASPDELVPQGHYGRSRSR